MGAETFFKNLGGSCTIFQTPPGSLRLVRYELTERGAGPPSGGSIHRRRGRIGRTKNQEPRTNQEPSTKNQAPSTTTMKQKSQRVLDAGVSTIQHLTNNSLTPVVPRVTALSAELNTTTTALQDYGEAQSTNRSG